jgi:hypothetical protein
MDQPFVILVALDPIFDGIRDSILKSSPEFFTRLLSRRSKAPCHHPDREGPHDDEDRYETGYLRIHELARSAW